jgi:hypothetical protein
VCQQLEQQKQVRLEVKKMAYPGVSFCLNGVERRLQDLTRATLWRWQDDDIVSEP